MAWEIQRLVTVTATAFLPRTALVTRVTVSAGVTDTFLSISLMFRRVKKAARLIPNTIFSTADMEAGCRGGMVTRG